MATSDDYVELGQQLLREIKDYIDECTDADVRLGLQMELTIIIEKLRALNLRCVP